MLYYLISYESKKVYYMENKSKKSTIADIAKIANVSPGTVSNALNNRRGVSESKKLEILQITKDLGYDKLIQKKQERSIRYVIIERDSRIVNDTFSAEMISGVENKCREKGYDLLITHITLDDILDGQAAEILSEDTSSGIIVLATEMQTPDLKILENVEKPLILMSSFFKQTPYNFVTMDNEIGVYTATEYLIKKGHRDIMLVGSTIFINNYFYRMKGFMMALMDYGLDAADMRQITVEPTLNGSYRGVSDFLKKHSGPLPTAIVTVNDTIAFGAIRALQEKGLKVPEDVSIIGFDDLPICQISYPRLTTIRVNKKEMGELAVQQLIELIEGKWQRGVSTVLFTELIERESVRDIPGVPAAKRIYSVENFDYIKEKAELFEGKIQRKTR